MEKVQALSMKASGEVSPFPQTPTCQLEEAAHDVPTTSLFITCGPLVQQPLVPFGEVTATVNLFNQGHLDENMSAFCQGPFVVDNSVSYSQTLPALSSAGLTLPPADSSQSFTTNYDIHPRGGFMEMLHGDSFNEFDAFLGCLNGQPSLE